MAKKNILVADDDQIILDLLKEILQDKDYRIFLASNGKEAVETTQKNPIDVAILDIKMPLMGGIEALKEIKEIDPSIEVLIMTGYADLDSLRHTIVEHGAFDYLVKPFTRTDIIHTIRNALLKRELLLQKKFFKKELEALILRLEKDFEEKTHQLRESQIKYKEIIENSNDMILVAQDGKLKFTNLNTLKLTGYTEEEILNMPFIELIHPEDRAMVVERHMRGLQGEDFPTTQSLRALRKNGEPFWVEINAVRTIWKERPATLSFIRDISERKQADDALRESEAQKRAILDASIDRIRYVDKDMRIIWANKTTALELDRSPEGLVGRVCYDLFLGKDTPCEGCPTTKARETGQIERAVMYYPKVKGIEGESYWDVYCVPLKNEGGDIVGFIQISRDITDQKRAEEHIHALTQQLMKAQENERQRISRDLHDNVAQDLSTLKVAFETLFDNNPEIPHEISGRVSEFSNILHRSIMAIRDLTYDLRPPSLDQLGLVRTVFQHCEDFSDKNAVSVDFYSAGMDDIELDFDTEINLYRLIQESLNNIKKHADASHVSIRLVASFPNILLRIVDDGKGFDMEKRLVRALSEKRMGLRSMEERVSLLHGKMRIQSCPNQGTRIFIEVPQEEKKGGSKEKNIDR